jgi:hypothetical protein
MQNIKAHITTKRQHTECGVLAVLIIWTAHSGNAFAADLADLDTTQFKFTTETKGSSAFCNLIASGIKAPLATTPGAIVQFTAAAMGDRQQGKFGYGYEVTYFESSLQHGLPSVPQRLQIVAGKIASDVFSSDRSAVKVGEGAFYLVKPEAVANFANVATRGFYYIEVNLADRRSWKYIFRNDESLTKAAEDWLKCIVQISR